MSKTPPYRLLTDAPHLSFTDAAFQIGRAQSPGEIVRLDYGDPAGVRFVAKADVEGPTNPAFSGFVTSAAYYWLEKHPDCAVRIEIEREGLRQKFSQFSFSQNHSYVIICVSGNESVREVVELLLQAIDEWRDGKFRLFDSDGYRDNSLQVNVPKNHAATVRHAFEVGIMLVYIALHFFGRS